MATECFGSIRRAAPGEFSGCITLREVLDSRRYRKQRRAPNAIRLCRPSFVIRGSDADLIGVKCPLEELERREQARGDRQIGFARWQFERVHQYGSYDLEIDTFQSTPEDCAYQLKSLLLSGKEPEAFRRLAKDFGTQR